MQKEKKKEGRKRRNPEDELKFEFIKISFAKKGGSKA